MLLTVVDYGVGNLRSIAKSIEKANSDNNLNYSVKVSSDVNEVKKSDKMVLPGQGSFKACKSGIDNIKGLQEELNESVLVKKKPIYGICAGMQLFATTGHEEEKTSGLNWIPGEVIKLDLGSSKLKIPHMGWNEVDFLDNPLFSGLSQKTNFYFVHSYCCLSSSDVISETSHGTNFISALAKTISLLFNFTPRKARILDYNYTKTF